MTAFEIKEEPFRQQVRQIARYEGWTFQYHTYDSRRSDPGFPDEVFVHPGYKRLIFVELKTNKGRISPAQQKWIDILVACGHEAAIWRPRDMEKIRRVLGEPQERVDAITPVIAARSPEDAFGWQFPAHLTDPKPEKGVTGTSAT